MSAEVAVPPATQPAATVPLKPLNPSQLKNLERILQGDFLDLRERVMYEINQQESRKLQEVEARFADKKKVEAAKAKIDAAEKKARETLFKLVESIEAQGLSFGDRVSAKQIVNVTVSASQLHTEGRDEAVRAVRTAASRLRDTANAVISRREREAQRRVLLAGITTATAADLVNGMPDSAFIMGEVQAQVAITNSDDLTTLGLTT